MRCGRQKKGDCYETVKEDRQNCPCANILRPATAPSHQHLSDGPPFSSFRLTRRRDARWTPRALLTVAVLMVWSEADVLIDAFTQARHAWVAMNPGRRRPGRTYQSFARHWPTCCRQVLPGVKAHLRQRLAELAASQNPLVRGWHCLAADGSKGDLPRTASNEASFGIAGKAGTHPQALITMLWDLSLGVIWDWRIGRADASERGLLRQMIASLPRRTLLVSDAGFPGYDLLRDLMGQGHDVLMRVGGNIHLLRKLGYALREYEGIVYLWPRDKRGREPLVLRLVKLHDGREAVYVITSVLAEGALDDQAVARVYAWRWGVEVQYRTLKQTMDQRKMRSRAGETAWAELQAAVLGAMLLGLLGAQALMEAGKDPRRLSSATALRVLRERLREPGCRRRGKRLWTQLRESVADDYVRQSSKRSRDYPRKKKEPPKRPPKVRDATPQEARRAQRFRTPAKRGAFTA